MICPICIAYISDWLRQPPKKDSEFYKTIYRKRILRNVPELSYVFYRIIIHANSLTPESIIKSEDYNAPNILNFYKSCIDVMNSPSIPEEHRSIIRMHYRNELVKCLMDQTCNTDLKYVLDFVTDGCGSRELFTISQWVADCLFTLRQIEFIHNDHHLAISRKIPPKTIPS